MGVLARSSVAVCVLLVDSSILEAALPSDVGVEAGVAEGASMVNSARLIASGKEALSRLFPEHIFSLSVVGVGRIEHIKESSSRLMTKGEQIVAFPIDAASRGTGTIYKTCT